jgi:NAD dependent epimerase/dehydratase
MKIKGKKVLVTGAGGFIGSHLTEKLVSDGAEVRAFVHYNSRNSWRNLEMLPKETQDTLDIVSGDVRDPFFVRHVVKDCDVVLHLAALIAIPYSYIAPRDFVDTNVLGTLNVMQACLDEGVEKVVHTSTSETYGTAKYVPIDEKHPLQGQSPYSASKIGADKIAESYYLSFDLPVATIRPFNTYGMRQSARAVIPTIISQALTNKKVKLGSLRPIRDYTYVSDTVQGFIRMVESDKSVGQVINIGSNSEVVIGNLAEKIISLIGRDAQIVCDESRIRPENSEVERLLCDNTKAMKLLGWEPSVSLEEGLKKTIEWISENISVYKPDIYNR